MGALFGGVELWRGAFKTIDGNFGASVVAYFRFVKWLFLVNFFTFLVTLLVLVLPHQLIAPDSFEDTIEGRVVARERERGVRVRGDVTDDYCAYF